MLVQNGDSGIFAGHAKEQEDADGKSVFLAVNRTGRSIEAVNETAPTGFGIGLSADGDAGAGSVPRPVPEPSAWTYAYRSF